MTQGQLMFYGGFVLAGLALMGTVLWKIRLRVRGKHLLIQLRDDYYTKD